MNTTTEEKIEKASEICKESSEFFKEHSYAIVNNFLSGTMCALLYHHVILAAQRGDHLSQNDPDQYIKKEHGTFQDSQAPGDYSKYGDPIFDALLSIGKGSVGSLTGLDLIPTYSYNRLYTTGSDLKRHTDRPSCEISTTLCLGYNVSNVDLERYPDWDWPIYVGLGGEVDTKGIPIHLKPGDMMIYRGIDLEHWREPFWGLNHAQVFLHYNDINGPYGSENLLDGRACFGIPSMSDDQNVTPEQHR